MSKNIKNWQFWGRRDTTLLPAFGVTESFTRTDSVLEIPFSYKNVRHIKSEWWCAKQEYDEVQNILKRKVEGEFDYFEKIYTKQQEYGEKLKGLIDELNSKNRRSVQDYITDFEKYVRHMHNFYSFWWLAIPTGDILEKKIKNILDEKELNINFDELIIVNKELELQKEERELMEMARRWQDVDRYEKLSKELKNELEKHADKYEWITTSYHLGKAMTPRDFFDKSKKHDPEKFLHDLAKAEDKKRQIRERINTELNPKDAGLIEAMQGVIFYRNYQKETVNEAQHRSEKFLSEIAGVVEMKLSELIYYYPDEVKKLLQNQINHDTELVKKRKDEFAVIVENGETFVPENSNKYYIDQQMEKANTNIIEGNPAFKGKVRGVVRVVDSDNDLQNFQEGEVLVTSMTTISFVQAMKKARAVVTDEGGITCHAAIFTREHKIPCVTGTVNATKILKDGDEVEVDAEKGMVRKI